MSLSYSLSTAQLRQALRVSEQIESLQEQLQTILGAAGSAPAKAKSAPGRKAGKRTMSDEARARIGAAAKARWAKLRAKKAPAKVVAKTVAKAAPKKKGGLTAEGKAKLSTAMKARWAARKKAAAPAATAA